MQGSQPIWSGHSAEAVATVKKLQDRRLKIVQDFNHGYLKPRVASRLVAAINRKIEEAYNNGEKKQNRRV